MSEMQITEQELKDRFLTALQIIEGTSITYRQLDYWKRTGIVQSTHGMAVSSARGQPIHIWESSSFVGSGSKVLWEKGHPNTRLTQEMVRAVDAGLDITLARWLVESQGMRLGPAARTRVAVLASLCEKATAAQA